VKQRLSTEDWFDIKFNARGVERIFTKDSSNIKDLIKKTAYQFSIGNDLEDRTFSSPDVSGFVKEEKTMIGTCTTTYVIVTTNESKDVDEDSDSRIILLAQSERYADQKHLHVSIQKNRKTCDYSLGFGAFLNGMKLVRIRILFYIYLIFSLFLLNKKNKTINYSTPALSNFCN